MIPNCWPKTTIGNSIQVVRIRSQDIGIESVIKKCTMLMMKSGKRQMTEGMDSQMTKELGRSEKRKPTTSRGYWKLTPSDMWRRKKKKDYIC